MSLIIRRPEQSDVPRIAVICREGWQQTVRETMSESYQHATISFWYREDKVRMDVKRGSYSYVAEMDGKVVGVIGGGMREAATSEIFIFYVDEYCRYQGIGKKLLETLTENHMSKGAGEQWVSVQEGNIYGLPFYEAKGFQHQFSKRTKTANGEMQVSLRLRREL